MMNKFAIFIEQFSIDWVYGIALICVKMLHMKALWSLNFL